MDVAYSNKSVRELLDDQFYRTLILYVVVVLLGLLDFFLFLYRVLHFNS